MRILLDTNIIIYSEDYGILGGNIQELFRLSEKYKIEKCIHKKSQEDIQKDKNITRKKIMLSKLKKYPELTFCKRPNKEYENICGKSKNHNDLIDDYILFSIINDAADYLITEDQKIFSKALGLKIDDRVFSVKEFCEFIKTQYEIKFPLSLPILKILPIRELSLSDPIFNLLRKDYPRFKGYPGFDDWFKKKIREDREAWVSFYNGKISSICIFDPHNAGYNGEMKICTFKVADSHQGGKLGELLLHEAIKFAYINKKKFIYIEVKKEKQKEYFINWLQSLGFEVCGTKKRPDKKLELVMIKKISPVPIEDIKGKNILDISIKHFPYYVKPPYVKAFLVPIQPQYTRMLFPDLESQLQIPGLENIPPCGKAIRKAYICKTPTRKIKKGDLVFFYESERHKSIIALGILEDIIFTKKADDIIKFIGKRSVYSEDQIKAMQDGKEITAFKFVYCEGLKKPIVFKELKDKKIIKYAPQSFFDITTKYNQFDKLLITPLP